MVAKKVWWIKRWRFTEKFTVLIMNTQTRGIHSQISLLGVDDHDSVQQLAQKHRHGGPSGIGIPQYGEKDWFLQVQKSKIHIKISHNNLMKCTTNNIHKLFVLRELALMRFDCAIYRICSNFRGVKL